MKCIKRSTLGIIIGSLNILGYCGNIVFTISKLTELKSIQQAYIRSTENDDPYDVKPKRLTEEEIGHKKVEFITEIIFCVAMIIASGFLITGIVKKRHPLIAPWLVLNIIILFVYSIKLLFSVFAISIFGGSFGKILIPIIYCVLFLGLGALVLYLIYTIYRDIKSKNNRCPAQIVSDKDVAETIITRV